MPTPAFRSRVFRQQRRRTTRRLGFVVPVLVVLAAVGAGPTAVAAGPGGWVPPLEPLVVVRGFEPPAGPYAPGHRGVDLAGTADQPVRAAGDGVVTYVGKVAGIGVVVVTHGQVRTTYQPLLGTVTLGVEVAGGDQIGRLTGMGSHCRPAACLHWGAVIGEDYIDPLGLLDPPPSRLLPYWDSEAGSDSRGSAGYDSAIPADGVATWSRPESGGITDAAATTRRVAVGAGVGATSDTGAIGAARTLPDPAQVTRASGPHRPLPAGAVAGIAVVGGVVAGAGFLAIRRRRG